MQIHINMPHLKRKQHIEMGFYICILLCTLLFSLNIPQASFYISIFISSPFFLMAEWYSIVKLLHNLFSSPLLMDTWVASSFLLQTMLLWATLVHTRNCCCLAQSFLRATAPFHCVPHSKLSSFFFVADSGVQPATLSFGGCHSTHPS